MNEEVSSRLEWWKRAVVYQIFPLSFQDSNGDGMGDLPGILTRLDHLEWLGVDAVWLSPVYRSPMLDAGYDVSDFTEVDPVFGRMHDLDRLIEAVHGRGIRLILDFVPNHTSDRHSWFRESRASRSSQKRDWYVWADAGPDGGPPNNWLSRFGGSAWEWDEATGQYYYHAFLKQQPDLNWRNPQVRAAMYDVLRFWLDRGVDGFRVDASGVLLEDALLRDDPPNPDFDEDTPSPERFRRVFTDSRPDVFDLIAELRTVVDKFPDRVLAGEADTKPDRISRFYGDHGRCGLHLPLNFRLLGTSWDIRSVSAAIDEFLGALPSHGCPNWALGGHDKPRIAERIGTAQARVAAMLHLTLPGTVFFYSGDELGMKQVPIPPELVRDPFERRVPGCGLNRDPERTPMRWDGSPKAGFTTGEPWLPIGENVGELNVAVQREDERSMLWLYRRLIALRKSEPALSSGEYEPARNQGDALVFRRRLGASEVLVALNLSGSHQELSLPDHGRVLLSTHLDRDDEELGHALRLRGDEGVIVRMRSHPHSGRRPKANAPVGRAPSP